MSIAKHLAATLFALLLAAIPVHALALVITIAPGSSPAGGYIPLSTFGIAPIPGVGDETINTFVVPSFSYAGQVWNQLGVVSNGYVIVGGGTAADVRAINSALPNVAAPHNMLAPFWTDLNPSAGGAIRIGTLTDGMDSWVVVDWDAVRNASNATTNSFEVWIGINGDANPGEDITFAYGPVGSGNNGLLTVGAQDASGTVGATYYFNGTGTAPMNRTQLRVTTIDSQATVPEPGTLLLLAPALLGLVVARRRRTS